MKKIATLFSTILLLTISSCDKKNSLNQVVEETTCSPTEEFDDREASICNTDLCTQYLDTWKELIQEKNNFTQEFHDSHIAVQRTSINSWVNGISFRVCYDFQIDWAVAYNCDKFIINIDTNNSLYPTIDLPRGVYLNKEQIALAVENRAFSSAITKMTTSTELTSNSLENTMSELTDYAEVSLLCFNQISLDSGSGNLVLKATAEYVDEENLCILGTFDLITGEKETIDTPCIF